jgi:coenzyme PQQ precursor peptide PqqA
MKWETPAYIDARYGFEVTMYINEPLKTVYGRIPCLRDIPGPSSVSRKPETSVLAPVPVASSAAGLILLPVAVEAAVQVCVEGPGSW